jgi:uncharacterized protein YprB with RNaseH-like and TPR domain
MELLEIKQFLREKPGYTKEGGKRLRKVLERKGFTTTINTCKQAIREVVKELRVKPYSPTLGDEPKILFYDIEVSYGLAKAWRPTYNGVIRYDDFVTKPKIICISWKWSDSDTVETVQWNSKQEDKTLLEQFIPELNKADFIVGHNGDKFDLPWIRTRALYHGLGMYPKYTSVDTLKIARYDHNFPSNKLDDLGDYLGLGRKIKTDMSLWDKVILDKCPKALDNMIKYCEQDVKLLESVYNKLSQFTLPTIHVGVLNGGIKQTSPYSGNPRLELIKTSTTKAGTVKRLMKCLDTQKYFEMNNRDYQKWLAINE